MKPVIRIVNRLRIAPFRFLGFLFQAKTLNIVTAADSNYFRSMLQLINSIKAINPKSIKIVAYDLGLLDNQIVKFNLMHPEISLKKFDFKKYPSFYDIKINAGEYGWKSAICKMEYEGLMQHDLFLWLDAGCFVRKKLYLIRSAILFFGFYSPLSGGSISKLTHPDTIHLLELTNLESSEMLSAGLIGLKKNVKNDQLVSEWEIYSRDKHILAPTLSNKSNHRQDQSLLSLLAYKIYRRNIFPLISKKWLEVLPHRNID